MVFMTHAQIRMFVYVCVCVCVCLCVCVYVCVPSRVVPPHGWWQATSMTIKSTCAGLDYCVLSSWHCMIAPFGTYQACCPAENLQTLTAYFLHKEQEGELRILCRLAHRICGPWWIPKTSLKWPVKGLVDRGEKIGGLTKLIVCELTRYDVLLGTL